MTETTAGYIPPPRSLLWVRPIVDDGKPAFDIGCDCATTCLLILDADDWNTDASKQLPYTCDGCASTHWFTVTIKDQRMTITMDPS